MCREIKEVGVVKKENSEGGHVGTYNHDDLVHATYRECELSSKTGQEQRTGMIIPQSAACDQMTS